MSSETGYEIACSWAGAILAMYSIFLWRFSALKIRLK
jgi:hypothetical protein